jgi:hypothetical protein
MTLSSPDLGSAITVGGALPPRRLPAGWVITAARAVFGSSSSAAIESEASGLAPVAGVWPVVTAELSAGTSTECASASRFRLMTGFDRFSRPITPLRRYPSSIGAVFYRRRRTSRCSEWAPRPSPRR